MAFKKEQIEALETALGIPTGQFDAMYKDAAEKDLPIGEYEIMKKTDFTERLKNEKAAEFTKGKNEGIQIQTREIAKGFGLTDIDKAAPVKTIVDAAKTKVIDEAKLPIEAKEKEWKKEKETLQGNIATLQTEKTTIESNYKQRESSRWVDNFIKDKMPTKGMVLEPGKLAILFKTDYSAKLTEDGKVVFEKDGEVLKNKTTQNPLTIDEILPEWQKPYVGKAGGGRGGEDEPGAGAATEWNAFVKEMENKGIIEGTPEFHKQRRERKIKVA